MYIGSYWVVTRCCLSQDHLPHCLWPPVQLVSSCSSWKYTCTCVKAHALCSIRCQLFSLLPGLHLGLWVHTKQLFPHVLLGNILVHVHVWSLMRYVVGSRLSHGLWVHAKQQFFLMFLEIYLYMCEGSCVMQ